MRILGPRKPYESTVKQHRMIAARLRVDPSPLVAKQSALEKHCISMASPRHLYRRSGQRHVKALREFPAVNRFAGTRLEDLEGNILALCRDEDGCQYLEQKLDEGVSEHRDMIFRETFYHFADLTTHPSGNYVCQKLIECASNEQRDILYEALARDLVSISLDKHGAFVAEKMVTYHAGRSQIDIVTAALRPHVVKLITDVCGSHVIEECLKRLGPENNQFIYDAIAQHLVKIATHRHGCGVLQRAIIPHVPNNLRAELIREITGDALALAQHPYGNYIVRYTLDLATHTSRDGLIRQFFGNVCALAVKKSSSAIIERCIRVAEPHTRELLIDELLPPEQLGKLAQNKFGKYCVQAALDCADRQQRAILVEAFLFSRFFL